MNWKDAAEISLAFRRCSWALEKFEFMKATAEELMETAGVWQKRADDLWRETPKT